MKKQIKILSLLSALAVSALFFTGCGGNGNNHSSSTMSMPWESQTTSQQTSSELPPIVEPSTIKPSGQPSISEPTVTPVGKKSIKEALAVKEKPARQILLGIAAGFLMSVVLMLIPFAAGFKAAIRRAVSLE